MNTQIMLIYRHLRMLLLLAFLTVPSIVHSQNDSTGSKRKAVDGYVDVGLLNILSEPEDEAAVYIDEVLVGYTPFLKKIAVGKHELCVRKEHYYDYNEVITVSEDKTVKKVRLELMYGYIKISSSPVGAMVFLNDNETTLMTPCMTGKVVPGLNKVSLKLDEYQTFDTVVDVKENSVSRIHADMVKLDLNKNMNVLEYLDQLYADTARLSMMLASNYIASQIDDADDEAQKKGRDEKSNRKRVVTSGEKKTKPEKKSDFGHAVWLKVGSGLSGIWSFEKISTSGEFAMKFPTFYAGMQYSYRFNRFIGLGTDLIYSRTGYKNSYVVDDYQYDDSYKFSAIDIPVLAKFYFLKNGLGPMVELGPIASYKMNYTLTRDSAKEGTMTEKGSYGALNVGATAGIGCDFRISNVVFTLNFRTVMELSRVFENVNCKLFYMQVGLGVRIY